MGIYRFEFKKLIMAPLVWVVLAIFILFNIAFMEYNITGDTIGSVEKEIESAETYGISLNRELLETLFYKKNLWRLEEMEMRFQQDTGNMLPLSPEDIYHAIGDILMNETVTEDIGFYERCYEFLGAFNQYYIHPESIYENYLLEEGLPTHTIKRVQEIIEGKECNDLLPTGFSQSTFLKYLFLFLAELFTLACVIAALPLGKDSGNTQLIIYSTKHGVNILVYKLIASLTVFLLAALILSASFFITISEIYQLKTFYEASICSPVFFEDLQHPLITRSRLSLQGYMIRSIIVAFLMALSQLFIIYGLAPFFRSKEFAVAGSFLVQFLLLGLYKIFGIFRTSMPALLLNSRSWFQIEYFDKAEFCVILYGIAGLLIFAVGNVFCKRWDIL